MNNAWEQELHDLLSLGKTGSELAKEQMQQHLLSEEVEQVLIESFSEAEQTRVSKLMKHSRYLAKSKVYAEYQLWFNGKLEEYWPTPAKPKLTLIKGSKQ